MVHYIYKSVVIVMISGMTLSACAVYTPGNKYDPENEKRINDLMINRDFVSPEERTIIDSEIDYRRNGIVIGPDPLIDLTPSTKDKPVRANPPVSRDQMLNSVIDRQLHGDSTAKMPPNTPQEPSR